MKIDIATYKLELTLRELRTILDALEFEVKSNLEVHWIHHQNRWKELDEESLYMIKSISDILNSTKYYDLLEEAKAIFEEYNNSTTKDQSHD